MKTFQIFAWALVALALIVAGALSLHSAFRRDTTQSAVSIGGPFALASTRGGVVASKDLTGKPYAIFFGFTHCPEVCPTALYEISNLLAKLGDDAKDFRVFFVTVDPERDTVESMRDYVANFDPRIEGLVPTLEQLPKLASDFRVYYAKQPTSDGSYTMDHTALVFLMDETGAFSGTMAYEEAMDAREAKLRNLILGRRR